MSQRQLPAGASQPTICAYFWAGIANGVLAFEKSKDWAYKVVEASESPPIEVIEIALANNRNSSLEALGLATDGADYAVAGRWLLADIHSRLESADISASEAVRLAMRVVHAMGLPSNVYYDFDALDDELQLAANGVYSSPDSVAADVLRALAAYSVAT